MFKISSCFKKEEAKDSAKINQNVIDKDWIHIFKLLEVKGIKI